MRARSLFRSEGKIDVKPRGAPVGDPKRLDLHGDGADSVKAPGRAQRPEHGAALPLSSPGRR